MTHDELLKKILKSGILGRELGKNEWIYDNKTNALRAVVELHKPYSGSYGDTCTCDPYDEYLMGYPCETIKAIEKELSNV